MKPIIPLYFNLLLCLTLGCTYPPKNSSNNTHAYVTCCKEDFDLSGKVKAIKVSVFGYAEEVRNNLPESDEIYLFDLNGNCVSANINDYTFSVPTHQIVEYTYDSSGNVVTENYTENGEFYGRRTYQYNPFKEFLYDWENELEETIATERKGSFSNLGFNGSLTQTHFDSKGRVFSKSIQYYKDGRLTKEEKYSDNAIEETTNYTYDSNGHMLLSKTHNSSGQETRKEVNTYSDGILVSTELYLLFSTLDLAKAWRYDSKGRDIYFCSYMIIPNLIQTISYEEDKYGNWTKQWVRDRNNKIVQVIEREIEYY